MSGGALNYFFSNLEIIEDKIRMDYWDMIEEELGKEYYYAILEKIHRFSEFLCDLEWYLSGDKDAEEFKKRWGEWLMKE